MQQVVQNGVAVEGRFYMKLDDGTTINVRSISSSGVGRWTVDVKNSPNLQEIKPSYIENKFEIKFK